MKISATVRREEGMGKRKLVGEIEEVSAKRGKGRERLFRNIRRTSIWRNLKNRV